MRPRLPRNSRRQTLPSSPLLLLQVQCCRVDAVAQAGRPRPVGKHVTEMPTAIRAHDLCADHSERLVALLVDRLVTRRRREGRPAATGVVLRLGAEKLRAAARTPVGASLEHVIVFARKRGFRALFAEDVVLLGIELRAPLGFGLLDFCYHTPSIGSSIQSCWSAIHYASEGCRPGAGRPIGDLKEEPR